MIKKNTKTGNTLNGIVLSILTLCMLLGAAGNASAMLLGTTGQGGATSTLYVVDQTTGTMTLIGGVGYAVIGMEYYNGTLYGVTSGLDPNFHGLITIDMTTGAGTPVGSGWGALPGGSFVVAEMAIDSSGNAYGWLEPSPGALVPIHLATGTLGVSPGAPGNVSTAALGLAFDPSDNLFLINRNGGVYDINTSDGVATPLGNLSSGSYAHHGDVDPATGIYWGLGAFPGGSTATLVSVNLGSLTVLSQVSAEFDLHTLSFSTDPEPVPDSGSGGGGWGCSVSLTRRPDEESTTGVILALLLPALILVVRKIIYRGHGRA